MLNQLENKYTKNRPKQNTSPSNELTEFCRTLAKDQALQLQVKNAEDPQEIIQIAAVNGYKLSKHELRRWSKELTSPYFPCSEMGSEWRRNFFN